MKKLPDTLHGLLKVALDDMKKCDEDKKYILAMEDWHDGFFIYNKCSVCLAGCVMAQTLKAPSKSYRTPADFPHAIMSKLWIIELMRKGEFVGSYIELNKSINPRAEKHLKKIEAYFDRKKKPKLLYNQLSEYPHRNYPTWIEIQKKLEDAGL